MLNALKRGLLLFLMLKFFLPYKFVSTIPGWECPVPHVPPQSYLLQHGKIKGDPLRKTICIEGMTQNGAQNPWLSALYKHPKISLLSTGLSLQAAFRKPWASRKPLIPSCNVLKLTMELCQKGKRTHIHGITTVRQELCIDSVIGNESVSCFGGNAVFLFPLQKYVQCHSQPLRYCPHKRAG